jgi:predicted dehydrogenase
MRKEWVIRAAEAGKHVLCEKPCACTVSDMEEMLEACRRNRVQFMDNVMFVHSARLRRLRQALEEPNLVGKIRRIDSAFSFYGDRDFFASNIRAQPDLEPHGCVGDLGWYCIRLSLWTLNWQMPSQVSGRLLGSGTGGVPTEFSAELQFADGVSAGFYCSFVTGLQQWAMISGTSGTAQLSDFVLPFAGDELEFETRKADFRINGCDFRMETEAQTIRVPESSHGKGNAQEVNCFRNFAEQIRAGQMNQDWPDEALKTQIVMCACLESARANGRFVRL